MGFFSPKNTPENAVKAQIDAKLAFINDKYTEIGRFVKLRMADKIEEPEVKNLIAQIDATLEELKDLNEQLLTIRGMKLCAGCGHEIPVNMAFCPNCGTKQPEMAQPVYQQPAQGGAVPMGAQPVMQNGQGYHNHPVSAAYAQPQANPVYGNPAQAQPVQTAAPIPEPAVAQTAAPIPQPETAPQPAPIPEPAVQPLNNEERPVADAPAPQPEPTPVIAETPAQEPAPAPVNSGFVFCSECGHKEPAGVKFCSECGTKL